MNSTKENPTRILIKKATFISTILFLVVAAYSCAEGSRKQDKQDKCDAYMLVSESATRSFELTGDREFDPQAEPDLYFSGELLRLLDSLLIRYDWRVTVSDRTISTLDGDTLAVSVYDFRTAQEDGANWQLIPDTLVVEKFVGVYPSPTTALYFSGNCNLRVVCRAGIAPATDLKNDAFRDFILRETGDSVRDNVK